MQGQSRFTAHKIAGFEAALTQNLSIVRVIGAPRYFHFDLNAGSGWNDKAGCYGSPIAFREAANKAGMPAALSFCCEMDLPSARRLQKKTEGDRQTYVVAGRNQDFVGMIPYIIKRYGCALGEAYGSILLDPNDQRRDAIPYEELRHVTACCPRLDVFFNFPQLAIKRMSASVQKGTLKPEFAKDCFDIDEMRDVIGRDHLWIKQTPAMGNFALVVGRNFAKVSHDRKTGLHPWDSELGLLYRERCKMPVDVAEDRHRQRMAKKAGQSLLFN